MMPALPALSTVARADAYGFICHVLSLLRELFRQRLQRPLISLILRSTSIHLDDHRAVTRRDQIGSIDADALVYF